MISISRYFIPLCFLASLWAGPAKEKPILDLREASFYGQDKAGEAGSPFKFDLGTKRKSWNHSQWSVAALPKATRLDRHLAIRLRVETSSPRKNCGVYLALREADGSWYHHPWAVDLADGTNENTILFENFHPAHWLTPTNPWQRFSDENGVFDRSAITHVALGVVQPEGIGSIEFNLQELTLVPGKVQPKAVVNVKLENAWSSFNDTDTIPAGVFGGFNLPDGASDRYRLAAGRRIHHSGLTGNPTPPKKVENIIIETVGDRINPSTRLTDPKWKEKFEALGESFGKTAREREDQLTIEFWNEPYLNWANHNRANFIPHHYNLDDAKEGGEVRIAHDGSLAPHLKWTKDPQRPLHRWFRPQDWRRGRDADGKVFSPAHARPYHANAHMHRLYGGPWQPWSHPPLEVKDGETYTVEHQGKTHELEAFTPWHIFDVTQHSYWSGKGMLIHYIEPMLAFGEGLRRTNPEAIYLAGWGMRPSEDRWLSFRHLYQPVIDAGIHLIDGVVDHDYGSDPAIMAANYELIHAYGITRHNKALKGYNTETASSADPQAVGASGQKGRREDAHTAKAQWIAHKIMHLLSTSPDKVRVLLHFGDRSGWGNTGWFAHHGEGRVLTALRRLRGRMMKVESSDPDVFVVASIDGSDPQNPVPENLSPEKTLCLAMYNSAQERRDLELQLPQPLSSKVVLHRIGGHLRHHLKTESLTLSKKAEIEAWSFQLSPGELVVIESPWGEASPQQKYHRAQQPGHGLLVDVFEEWKEVIPLPKEKPQRAWLRLCAERLDRGECSLTINGHSVEMPPLITPENGAYVVDVALPLEILQSENEIHYHVKEGRAGFFLVTHSIITEHRQP